VTVFDYAVLAIVAASILLGAWRGLVSEVLALAPGWPRSWRVMRWAPDGAACSRRG
jgi:hypothetical protein